MNLNKSAVITFALFLAINQPCVYAQDVEEIVYPDNEIEFCEQDKKDTLKAFQPLEINFGDVIFKQVTRRIDLIDPVVASGYYPGGRGPNKLVIYTADYGEHTGTNEFGTEAIVTDNVVTSLSGADSAIPKNGLVISGHGSAKNWISQNITVGSKVYVDSMNKTITVYTTS